MKEQYNLIGKKFNKLLVIKRIENDKYGNAMWLCECDCGKITKVLGTHLRSNHTKSCGCLKAQSCKNIKHKPKHGMIKTRIYRIWTSIKRRCYNKNSKDYKYYGKRKIKVCKEWKENFMNFYNWAIENGYNEHLKKYGSINTTIDRINVDGNYEPSNCRWVTMKEQQNNKRNNTILEYNGLKLTISQWEEKLNFPHKLITNRLKRGWSIEKTLTTKPIKR